MKFLLAAIFLFLITNSSVFASTEVNFGNCSITPQEYTGTNPTLSGNTFLVNCDNANNSNVIDLSWTNNTGKEINQYSLAFSSPGYNYYWYKTSKSEQYTKSAVTINEVISQNKSINYKVMLNPTEYIQNPTSEITLTFEYCSTPNSSYNCETVKQEKVNLNATLLLTLPDPKLNNSMLAFGNVNIENTQEKSFTISNNSSKTPYIFKILKTSGSKNGFTLSDGLMSKIDANSSVSVGAGESKTYSVKFKPTEPNDYTLLLNIVPFDTEMAKYIPSKTITFSGQGTHNTAEVTSAESPPVDNSNNSSDSSNAPPVYDETNINFNRINEENLSDTFKVNWELTASGELTNFPWKVQINTNCEGRGLENNGSFKWEIHSLKSGETFNFSNSVKNETLSDGSYSLEFTVIDSSGSSIHTQHLEGISCFEDLPVNEKSKSAKTPVPPNFNQNQSQQQSNRGKPILSSDNMTLEDLEQQKLNIAGKIKGESDESGNGFIARLLGYIVVVGGIAAATIYMKKGMVVDKVIIPDAPDVYDGLPFKDSSEKDSHKSVTNIKME